MVSSFCEAVEQASLPQLSLYCRHNACVLTARVVNTVNGCRINGTLHQPI